MGLLVRARWAVVVLAVALMGLPATARADEADRENLKREIQKVLQQPNMRNTRLGVMVRSLDDGKVLFSHNADDLLNPASNVKLVTSAAALVRLGPEYRFQTEFLTDGEVPASGKIQTLYVRGRGDPTINTERLYGIVGELAHRGLKEIREIVIDDSWFDEEREAPGYDQEDSDRSYMSPTGAVSLNWNAAGIYLRPGASPGAKGVVELEPPSGYFVIDSSLSTGSRRYRRFSVRSEAFGDRQKIIVRGTVPHGRGVASVWKKIDNPPMYFGHTLKAMLEGRGVKIRGKVKLGNVAPGSRLLYVAHSETLDLVVKHLNKVSSNFIAEQLIKTLAAEVKGAPGSFTKGIEVIEEFLAAEIGIPRGTYVMKNGSGLNDTNRFSAAQLSKILVAMHKKLDIAPEYVSSLGIAGKDGTLRYRFDGSEAAGRLRAKTGTLENVTALSGYVNSVGGERFVFSMMANDFPGRAGPVIRGLDAMGAVVAGQGAPQRGVNVAEVLERQNLTSDKDEVKTRVRTYLTLGKQSDARNIDFLRTALRNEKDAAVRAVLAEALYESDRTDYLGARALLDAVAPTDEVYGKLRRLARELEIDVPGVSSLVELAAEGNTEALSRVVELSRPATGDPRARKELAEALVEVSRTAPNELLVALKGAEEADRDACLTLLGRGLAGAGESDHPLWAAIKKSLGSPDTAYAKFVQSAESALSLEIARLKAPDMDAKGETIPSGSGGPAVVSEERPGG